MDYSFVSVLFLLNIWLILLNSEVAAQEGPGIVIVRPAGQDVELLCSVATSGTPQAGVTWIIDFNQYAVASLANGILNGYSADITSSNLIVKNIVMNDIRNNTEYRCAIIMSDMTTEDSDSTFLYVAGVPAMVPGVTVNNNTIDVTGSNVTFTLSWGEPFNNLDPIVNYTVSWSGDVTCPPNFTTTDNTTRSCTIINLTPMTNYTFSVVATNSIGSGEAGVVINITAMSSMGVNTTLRASTLTIVATTSTCSISTTTTTATPSISTTTTTATSSISTTATTAAPSISTTNTTAKPASSNGAVLTLSSSSITTSTSSISTTITPSNVNMTEGITIAYKYIITIIVITSLMLSCCGCMCIMFCCCCIQRENYDQYEKLCAHSRISFVAFVILGVLTFGISLLIWFIYLKCQNNEKDDYYKIIDVSIVVLGIYTCGISVLLWWMYKGITKCGISSSKDAPTVPLSFLRLQANEVPSVSNKLAEYDDTKASWPTESAQVSVEVPDYATTDEMNKSLQTPVAYAVVNSKDVVARQKAAAGALQTSIQHHTTANGEKYALPDKLTAKNKAIVANQKVTTGTQQAVQCQNTASEGTYALPEVVVKDKSIRYVEVKELPTSGKIRTSKDTFTPYAKIC